MITEFGEQFEIKPKLKVLELFGGIRCLYICSKKNRYTI